MHVRPQFGDEVQEALWFNHYTTMHVYTCQAIHTGNYVGDFVTDHEGFIYIETQL
jgi:hypothetical protein